MRKKIVEHVEGVLDHDLHRSGALKDKKDNQEDENNVQVVSGEVEKKNGLGLESEGKIVHPLWYLCPPRIRDLGKKRNLVEDLLVVKQCRLRHWSWEKNLKG